jgi:hypothetical protein
VLVVAQLAGGPARPSKSTANRLAATSAAAPTTEPPRFSETLKAGGTLKPGDYLISTNGEYNLVMGKDGYLSLFMPIAPSVRIWSRGKGIPGTRLSVRLDGNIVLVTPDKQVIWQTRTSGHPASRLVLQDDRNIVARAPDDTVLWESRTQR